MVESAELAQDVAADVARADPADEVYDDERWRWMDAALLQARLALDAGEAPIGAVVVGQDGRVVSAAFNTMFGTGNPIAHAEINALGLTARKIVSRESLTLVTTLEPCVMCADAAMQSGVRRIVFGMKAPAEACLQRTQAFNANVATNPVWEGGLRSTESRRLFEAWLTRHEGDTDRIQQRAFVRQLLAST
jgi:tRNA(adenine34) deaminase